MAIQSEDQQKIFFTSRKDRQKDWSADQQIDNRTRYWSADRKNAATG